MPQTEYLHVLQIIQKEHSRHTQLSFIYYIYYEVCFPFILSFMKNQTML